MEWFKEIFNQLWSLLKWWVIVQPWEQGLRIRLGKKVKLLDKGIHFRLPYFDSVYVQPIRLTYTNMAPQTLLTKDGRNLTIALIVGYKITDVFKLYNSVSEVEGFISGSVMGEVSDFICSNINENCKPDLISTHLRNKFKSMDFGLCVSEIKVTSFAEVKTYRLIQDTNWMGNGHKLNTKI